MQNLLNEKDFVKPVKYNPWKWFITYYGIAFVFLGLVINLVNIIPHRITSIASVAMFVFIMTSPFIMVFGKNKTIYHTDYPTLITAVTLMAFNSWFFTTLHIKLGEALKLNNFSLLLPGHFFKRQDFTGLLVFMIYGAVSLLIILFIVKYKRKKATI
ncbi:hypothetical protein [Flavobacterium beibuense]|uniref:Uncharacterized protein n=1 Tax=Flavobacterium beibuense TaxID=657326 RepID=A0A444WEU2_9FLAO|nr:hypothetical protein [Flavobacterium beibuense]RYJ44368.1 hypothetical protein NU09_0978 [Flavobacterium beibuense]